MTVLENYKTKDLPLYAWPGGYPLYYIDNDGWILCPQCARKNDEYSAELAGADVNWEDDSLYCDHCGESIQSAYGD